ncbi:hypothetical protein [Paraglaciecola sp.]|uniref:hypothetical protein n=1 Tax=Paraglaciecola sp. TaxID=1920173 RepID=UPI0032652A8F
MSNFTTNVYLGALSLLSSAAFAHEGHDHNHWSSDALHILFYGSLVTLLAVVSFLGIKQLRKKESSKSEEL